MNNSRRDFLKKASLATAGLSLGTNSINAMSAKSYRNIIGANDRLHVAIQGLGRRYFSFIEAIAREQNNIRLEYLCDVMPEQITKAQEKVATKLDYKIKSEEDFSNVLNDKNIAS